MDHNHLVLKLVHLYAVGAPCYALYCGPKRNRQPRWVPAVVTKVFGTRTVNVRVTPKGPTWRRHIDQLRPRYGVKEDEDPGEDPRPTPVDTQVVSGGPDSMNQSDHPRDAEGTNTTDGTLTPPNPLKSTDCPSTDQPGRRIRRRLPQLPPRDAEYGPHNPRRSKRLQAKKEIPV